MSAKKKTAAKSSGFRGYYLLLGVVAAVGVAAIGYAVRGKGGGAATEPIDLKGVDNPSQLVAMAEGVSVGKEDAPVTLIIFSDYQCPGCAQFAARIKPVLEENEVKAGKARIVYYDLPLTSIHPHAFLAARAARCAGDQGKYWELHEEIFHHQSKWSSKRSAPIDEFKEYAAKVGVDQAAFASCLESDRYAETVTANAMLARQLGVNSTPTVIINNRRIRDPFDYNAISQLIAEEAGS